jgi:circadian clock protein KaiC
MASIGFDLQRWVENGLLHFEMSRAIAYGFEKHLVQFHDVVTRFEPSVVILDPATSLLDSGSRSQAESVLLRTIDFLKVRGTTALMTSLTKPDGSLENSGSDVSSVVDSWLLLRDLESSGERNRGLYVLKSRGMAHSNQIREFFLTSSGIKIRQAYLGANGVLTGSARAAQEAAEQLAEFERQQELQHRRIALEHKRKELEARISALQAETALQDAELQRLARQEENRQLLVKDRRERLSESRQVAGQQDGPAAAGPDKSRKAAK